MRQQSRCPADQRMVVRNNYSGPMMRSKGVSIALVMKFTVLIALNLALLRFDVWILQSPLILFVLVALDLVLARALILGRPLRAFDYTFLAVGIVMAIVLTL